jgi:tRNA modification GTPase
MCVRKKVITMIEKNTIFAISSGGAQAGVALIRVSGEGAGDALRALSGLDLPTPRMASRVAFRDPETGEHLDDGLALWFPGPASYSGEDVAELHIHGGRAVIQGVMEAMGKCPGLRLAEPGEFTRRAFENGKLDLTAAEGIADLIAAQTAAQRRQALRQARGGLGETYEEWRQMLLRAMAHQEAAIDFPEEDLPPELTEGTSRDVRKLENEIRGHLADGGRGERLRDGVYVAIIGPPNAGKSSLLNTIAQREAAIVSATAGTTRDVIEVEMDLGGLPVTLADTAGLREAENDIEREGVKRAIKQAEDADICLIVLDATTWPNVDDHTARFFDGDPVIVVNKADLREPAPPLEMAERNCLPLSVKTGLGVDGLLGILEKAVAERFDVSATPALTRMRHRDALGDCLRCLERFGGVEEPELGAEELRLAARFLGRITGRVDVEDVLDVIFGEFCIGK